MSLGWPGNASGPPGRAGGSVWDSVSGFLPERRLTQEAAGVEVDQCVRGDSVEGQSASRTVHIHCYSVRDRDAWLVGVQDLHVRQDAFHTAV
ncbi:hypothetical protein L3Q82_001899 [Scortum barcoo]|uniref:Uncharacterized protein n=1 Tax=Scortum barcoo TaxID=214431 RepID=A0ACB8W548_9TELE|nr:hypothetical protein L3Q82_001899 [Scortum barcoo]